jgi:hypothetical protein
MVVRAEGTMGYCLAKWGEDPALNVDMTTTGYSDRLDHHSMEVMDMEIMVTAAFTSTVTTTNRAMDMASTNSMVIVPAGRT